MSGSGVGNSAAALRAAAKAGDVAGCQSYLGCARCVRFSRDEEGRSALHLAASGGHGTVVRLLLNVAAPREVDSTDGTGCTALQRAAADGHEEVLKLLLARGADVDRQDSIHGNCAIHEAAWKGYSRSVRLLAAAGAKLSKTNAGGFTALHLSCQNGHNQTCRELLLAGCDPNIQNNYGDTSLHTAARYGHAGVTRVLISAQCRVSDQNKNGDTALHIAAAMGRRKLSKILLEAGCDKNIRNKQGETARDIALRKDLSDILDILDHNCAKKDKKIKIKKRSKSKVRFDKKYSKDIDNEKLEKPKDWSPYGCHYYPDPEAFPSPNLDSLPQEPLKRGEQYYLDLAGNICKGPVGVGYTCYCAPLFRHLEARMEKDRRDLRKAQARLGQRVAGLEQKLLNRTEIGRRSERTLTVSNREQECLLTRSRSLEVLDSMDKPSVQATRSMDELDSPEEENAQRPSVKELVARIQKISIHNNNENRSESSDDEDNPLRIAQHRGLMGNSNMIHMMVPNYENFSSDAPPRCRSGVYSPTIVNTALVDSNTRYLEPVIKLQESSVNCNEKKFNQPCTSKQEPKFHQQEIRYIDPPYNMEFYEGGIASSTKYYEHNTRLAKLRVLDSAKLYDSKSPLDETARRLDMNCNSSHTQDNIDIDTNNDSGYSTKVYGSSKGNSPSLSGQIEGDGIGASSLV